jgi:hypothetical protein
MPVALPSPLICLLLAGTLGLSACKGSRQESPPSDTAATQSAPLLPGGQPASAYAAPQLDAYVVEAFEDSKGHLWFGTNGQGAARYDGQSLTYFSVADGLCDATVTSIIED